MAADRRNGSSLRSNQHRGAKMNPYGKSQGAWAIWCVVVGLLVVFVIALHFMT
jgi:hypothetical protein